MIAFTQKAVLTISPGLIKNADLSVPYWAELGDPGNDANKGIIRHGGLKNTDNHVPSAYKPSYPTHIKRFLERVGDGEGMSARTLLAIGARDTFQNLGKPGYHRGRSPQVLRRPDEPLDTWDYQAFCGYKTTGGAAERARVGIEHLRFRRAAGPGANYTAVRPGGDDQPVDDIEWAVAGQPVLWDGEVPPLSLLTACTYDLRHTCQLLWEEWQVRKWPEYKHHQDVHDTLMTCFMEHLNAPVSVRAAALAEIAARESLAVTDGYLLSSAGVRGDGTLVLVMMTGSLTDVGRVQRDLGSVRAVLLDEGGSCGAAYWPARGWASGAWGVDNPDKLPRPVYFGNNTYFRPRGHALMVFELTEDIVEPALAPRPSGGAAWRSRPA